MKLTYTQKYAPSFSMERSNLRVEEFYCCLIYSSFKKRLIQILKSIDFFILTFNPLFYLL